MAKKSGLGKGLDAIFIENESEDQNSTVSLKISEIEPNREQPRRDFDEGALAELAQSISEHGLLQPLLVRPLIGGGYQIVAGERRYRACRMAGLSEVPVIIRELTDAQTMQLALIENLQRENLNPMEEAGGFKALIEEYGLTQDEVAKSVAKSRPAVANALRLLKLPKEAAEMVSSGILTSGHARAILALEDEEEMIKLAKTAADNDLSVRQTEKIVQAYKKDKEKPSPIKEKASVKPTYFCEVELALTEFLGKKVTVAPLKGQKGGVLSIEFYSDDDLRDIAKRFEEN